MDNSQNNTQTPVTPTPDTSGPASGPAPVMSSPNPGKSNKLGVIIAAVVGILLIGGAVFAFTKSSGDDDKKTTDASSQTEEKAEEKKESQNKSNNAVTADSASDFAAACTNGSVKNAAAYKEGEKPHKVVVLSKKSGRSNFSTESVGYDKAFYVKSDTDMSTVSVVACLEVVEGSEAKGLTCDYEKDGKTVNVDLMSARYSLTYYSAQNGEKIGEGEEINAPATRCPSFLAYDQSTMKAQAAIDDNALEAEISKFAL